MLSERFQADVAAADVRVPGADGTPLPEVFTKFAVVPRHGDLAARGRDRRAPRRVDRAVDRRGGPVRRRAEGSPGLRRAFGLAGLLAAPVAFLAVLLRVAGGEHRRARPRGDHGWHLERLGDVFSDAQLRHVMWFTVWQAAASTVLTLVVALPGAYVLARYEFRGRRLVQAVVTVPFVLPTVVVGSAFVALLGPTGPLGIDLNGTVWAILLAHVFFNYAVVVRVVGGLW